MPLMPREGAGVREVRSIRQRVIWSPAADTRVSLPNHSRRTTPSAERHKRRRVKAAALVARFVWPSIYQCPSTICPIRAHCSHISLVLAHISSDEASIATKRRESLAVQCAASPRRGEANCSQTWRQIRNIDCIFDVEVVGDVAAAVDGDVFDGDANGFGPLFGAEDIYGRV